MPRGSANVCTRLYKTPTTAAIAPGPVARTWSRLLVAVGLPRQRDRTPQDAMRAQAVSYYPLHDNQTKPNPK